MVSIRLHELRVRARAWPPLRVDAALGGALLLEAILESAFVDVGAGARLAGIGLAGLVAIGVFIRRRHPIGAVALALLAFSLLNLLPKSLQDVTEGQFFGLLFLVYSMALRTSGRRLWLGVGMTTA